MMSLLSRYIMLTVLKAVLAVMLITIAVDGFIVLAKEMSDIGQGQYGLRQVLVYVVMTLPSSIYSFFSMISLLGALIGLGYLSSSSELMVMRASGMSIKDLMVAVFMVAFLLCLTVSILGETLVPELLHHAQIYKERAVSGNQAIETQQGIWIRVNQDFLHIKTVIDRYVLLGVTRYQVNDNQQLIAEMYAEQLNYQEGGWVAHDVRFTRLDQYPLLSGQESQQLWDIRLKPGALAFGYDDPAQLSINKLSQYIAYRDMVGLPNSQYRLAFWQRVFQPLAMVVMVLLALPFVFMIARSGGLGLRVMIGVMVGVGFYLVNQFMGQLSIVYHAPALIAALLPVCLFFMLGVFLLKRVR